MHQESYSRITQPVEPFELLVTLISSSLIQSTVVVLETIGSRIWKYTIRGLLSKCKRDKRTTALFSYPYPAAVYESVFDITLK